jgi:hypothetical protein
MYFGKHFLGLVCWSSNLSSSRYALQCRKCITIVCVSIYLCFLFTFLHSVYAAKSDNHSFPLEIDKARFFCFALISLISTIYWRAWRQFYKIILALKKVILILILELVHYFHLYHNYKYYLNRSNALSRNFRLI